MKEGEVKEAISFLDSYQLVLIIFYAIFSSADMRCI